MSSIVETRYEGIIDQIDFYQWVRYDLGKLSPAQKKHLIELRDMISVFGERGEKWHNLANELLR